MLDEAAEQFEKVEVRAPDLPAHPRLPRRGLRAARAGPRGVRGVPPRAAAPRRASSGPIAARRAAPSPRAGSIGVRRAVAGTPPALAPPARRRRRGGSGSPRPRPRLPAASAPCASERLGPGRRDPLCGGAGRRPERIAPRVPRVRAAVRAASPRADGHGRRGGPRPGLVRRLPCASGRRSPTRGRPPLRRRRARGPARVQVRGPARPGHARSATCSPSSAPALPLAGGATCWFRCRCTRAASGSADSIRRRSSRRRRRGGLAAPVPADVLVRRVGHAAPDRARRRGPAANVRRAFAVRRPEQWPGGTSSWWTT